MTRLILASLALATSILPSYGQNSILHTDRSGSTTGTVGNSIQNTCEVVGEAYPDWEITAAAYRT
jgi:hypothetical protein